jgi:hypothetical protein
MLYIKVMVENPGIEPSSQISLEVEIVQVYREVIRWRSKVLSTSFA